MKHVLLALMWSIAVAACGPTGRSDPNEGTVDAAPIPDTPVACVPTQEQCTGFIDEDCDGLYDCRDPDCSGIGDCPVCGMVQHAEGDPLSLPDGVGSSYTTQVVFTDFGPAQIMNNATDIVSVCVTMEHSWLRDLRIELVAPGAQVLVLQQFLGQTGSEVFVGQPVDNDDFSPVAGVGAKYCWTPNSVRPAMLTYANQTFVHDLPPGDYGSALPFTGLVGTLLNGTWMLRVTDLWGSDNGFIFDWSISFDPTLVQDCSTPPIQ